MASAKIFAAAHDNDLEKVKMLIEKGGVLSTIKDEIVPAKTLFIAAKNGYLDMLKYLLKKYPSLLSNSLFKRSALLDVAVYYGNLEIVKYLVENQNANIYEVFVFSRKFTAINWAICTGNPNILKYFIEERNVDVNKLPTKDDWYYDTFRPLLFDAVIYERIDIITYLVEERQADLTVVDQRNENVLFTAVRKGNLKFIKYILDKKKAEIDMNWKNIEGQTLVQVTVTNSCNENSESILRYLIDEKHADFDNSTGAKERTALQWTICAGHDSRKTVEYLIDRGANVGKQDVDGDTALHLGVDSKSDEDFRFWICKYLCEHGADLNHLNNKGKTPLDIATQILFREIDERKRDAFIGIYERFRKREVKANSTIAVLVNEMMNYAKHGSLQDEQWNSFEICKYLIEHGAKLGEDSEKGERLPDEIYRPE